MDDRVVEFRKRLSSYADKEAIPAPALRDEILRLHAAVTDEASRIELMRLFNIIADIVANHLKREGHDLAAFNAHRAEQIHIFLLDECRMGALIDGLRLLYVTDREIRAGRMHEHDPLRRYALGEENAFRPN